MKPEIITLANKVLHDLNFDKTRTTTQIVAEAISNYAEQQEKTCNKPDVMFSEERAKVCKDNETWKRCLVWAKDSRCLKGCPLHLQT